MEDILYHQDRTHTVEKFEPDQAHALAEKIRNIVWTPCTGFQIGNYLLLNDATSPDGAQEYAVIDKRTKTQVESLTISWMEISEIYDILIEFANDTFSHSQMYLGEYYEPEKHGSGGCEHCY